MRMLDPAPFNHSFVSMWVCPSSSAGGGAFWPSASPRRRRRASTAIGLPPLLKTMPPSAYRGKNQCGRIEFGVRKGKMKNKSQNKLGWGKGKREKKRKKTRQPKPKSRKKQNSKALFLAARALVQTRLPRRRPWRRRWHSRRRRYDSLRRCRRAWPLSCGRRCRRRPRAFRRTIGRRRASGRRRALLRPADPRVEPSILVPTFSSYGQTPLGLPTPFFLHDDRTF